ncbi:putative iron/ascorbate-dependent oxidoreductase, partial [Yersinia pestis PY-88]
MVVPFSLVSNPKNHQLK